MKKMKTQITTLLLALSLLSPVLFASPVQAAEPPAPKPAPFASVTVADFAWLAGSWQGEVQGSFVEELWSTPAGGGLMGMFRWMNGGRDGTLAMYELLSLEPGAEGPILWLRHFNPKLVGWEDKEGAIAFHLVAYKPGEATFDNRDPEKPARITYRREGGDRLISLLERKAQDGKPTVTEFVYQRQ